MNALPAARTVRCTLLGLALLLALSNAAPASAQMSSDVVELEKLTQLERTLGNPDVRARLTPTQWAAYGERLSRALASGHDGLRQGALRMIIQYGPYLHIKRPAVFDVVRIYRNHENDNLRRMAVVALGQTNDAWALDFLKRSVRFEKTPRVLHTIVSVLEEHGYVRLGPAKVGGS